MGAAGKLIPNPSTCLYSLPLNKKKELVTANSRKVLKRFLVKPKKVEDGLVNNFLIRFFLNSFLIRFLFFSVLILNSFLIVNKIVFFRYKFLFFIF